MKVILRFVAVQFLFLSNAAGHNRISENYFPPLSVLSAETTQEQHGKDTYPKLLERDWLKYGGILSA